MAPASTVDRLNVRVPGALTSEERAAWGRRAARALREVNLDPPGLPPAAILVVRRLTDPLPRALLVGEPWQAADTWGEAARSSLTQRWRSAGRPFRSPVGSDASAVWFADPAEWLACLSLDLRRTQAAERWWWRSWLAQGPAAGGLASLWTAEARWLPAALTLLAQRQVDEMVEVVGGLSEAEANGVRRAVVQAHRLPVRLADSRLDLERCRALLSGRRLALPSGRAPAELLTLALLIGAAPALAHDPRLAVGHLTDAGGHGEPPSDPDLPLALAPTPGAPSPKTVVARSAAQQADPTLTDSTLDVAPAHARDSILAVDEQGTASAENASGPAAREIRPSPSQPTGEPSDDLLGQAEDADRWPAPVAPAHPASVTRQPSPNADRADAPVVAAASPALSGDDTATLSELLPPHLDEAGVETGLGGVWYLVNLLVILWLDDAEAEPADAWRVLRELAVALLEISPFPMRGRKPCAPTGSLSPAHRDVGPAGRDYRAAHDIAADVPAAQRRGSGGEESSLDPIWSILDHLIGHATEALPLPTAVGRDVGEADIRAAQRSGGGVSLLHRSRAWLADAGFTSDEIPGLLRQPARLFVTRTHVDLIFRLDQIDLKARLAGLDRDPGWVPALGRVISFQYR
jgi:hypothetical protein